jgi:hypothetical protein
MRPGIGSAANRRACSVRKKYLLDSFTNKPTTKTLQWILRSVDWGRVHWELQEISGMALRHVRVDLEYQHALDEARDQAARFDILDERQEVVDHWRNAKSWIVPLVAVSCDYSAAGQDSNS